MEAEPVVDVPVIICDKLQQVFVENVKVPQIQFIDRVVVQLLHRDRYTVQTVQKSVEILQAQFLDWLGHPLLYNDRRLDLTVQKTVEVPQVQYSDWVVDVPACSSSTRFGRPCDFAVTSLKGFF